MGKMGEQITTVALAIVGIAMVAVILSKNANTSAVISAAGAGFSKALSSALSPVSGNNGMSF